VEIPGSGKQYFVSIMGVAGIMPGLSAYEGASSLASFWEMDGSENPDASDLLSIPHLIVSFENEENTDPEQVKRIRSLGFDKAFGGTYAEARHNIPGRYPYAPSDDALAELLIIIEQSIEVLKEAQENPEIILPEEYDEDYYLVRTPSPVTLSLPADGILSWRANYIKVKFYTEEYQLTYTQDDIDELISLPAGNAAMQAHSQLLPMQVEHNGMIYFSYIAILVNKRTGRVENVDTMIADPDYNTMIGKVPAIFIRFIKSLGFRPRVIEVKSDLLFDLLNEPLTKCGIRLNKYKELPAVTEAVNSILEYSKRS